MYPLKHSVYCVQIIGASTKSVYLGVYHMIQPTVSSGLGTRQSATAMKPNIIGPLHT